MRFILLALLLALPFAAADYFVAVSEDAPATDVIFAANFAQSMKQETGVEFSGVIDQTLYDEHTIYTLEEDSVVLLNGEDKYALYIIGGAASSKHESVAQAAVDYLEDKGYKVAVFDSYKPYSGRVLNDYYPKGYELQHSDLLVQPLQKHANDPNAEPEDRIIPLPNEAHTEQPEEDTVVIVPIEEPVVAVPVVQETPVIPEQPQAQPEKPVEQPSAIKRFFSWIGHLFS
jgi:hypothetical protein